MRPQFNEKVTLQQFQDGYWYKTELQEICRKYSLPTNGGKLDLKERLEQLIRNNFNSERLNFKSLAKERVKTSSQALPTSIHDKIPSNFTCSELYRKYFKSLVGERFHYTAYMMKYLKANPEITFKQYIDEWMAEEQRRKDKSYKPEIMKSTQYNQYIRDFYENNPGKSLKDAIKCWNYRKSLPGGKVYSDSDLAALSDTILKKSS